MKVCRSDAEAYYLAHVLSGLPHGEPLSLLGYSLGCRTASGALAITGRRNGRRPMPSAHDSAGVERAAGRDRSAR